MDRDVNIVDLVVLGLVVAAVVTGAGVGAALQVLSFGGFWLGLLAGSAAAPTVARLFNSTVLKITAGLVTPFLVGGVLAVVGGQVGRRAAAFLDRVGWRRADAAAGSVFSAGAALLSLWLAAFILAAGPWPAAAREIQGSAVLRALDRTLPNPPSVLSRIQRVLDPSGFPSVFAGLEPDLGRPVALPDDAAVRTAAARAAASTVRVVGTGCGGVVDGSGFVAGAGFVVTNAHVVAGITRPVVEDRRGRHAATAVLFDAGLDVAVLRADGLAGPVLALAHGVAAAGTEGAVLGYPGGGPFRAVPAAVRRSRVAVGRDIYGDRLTARAVYELQATIRPGNSGGPLVSLEGTVLGVVFSRSVAQSNVGYALLADDVASRLRTATTRTGAVSTGDCAE
jgi:S1-C subfamily serine protease